MNPTRRTVARDLASLPVTAHVSPAPGHPLRSHPPRSSSGSGRSSTRAAMLIAVTLAVAACSRGGGGGGSAPSTPVDPVTSLSYPIQVAVYAVGVAIPENVPVVGGGTPNSFTASPALPPGIELDPVDGTVRGTPTAASPVQDYQITAANGSGSATATLTLSVTALPTPPSSLSYSDPAPTYTEGVAIAPDVPSWSGGAPTSYSVAPALPPGLLLDAGSGVISGTPLAAATTSDYTVTASNAAGSTTATLSVTVLPAPPASLVYADPAPVYVVGSAVAPDAPTVSGGTPTAFSVAPPLPSGLALDPVSGVIDGTPVTAGGPTDHTVTASNPGGSASATLSITILPEPPSSLTYADAAPVYTVGVAITPNVPTVGGGTPSSYAVDPALPDGLTLDAATGIIDGMPTTVTAAADYTVTAANPGGQASVVLSITVDPPAPTGLDYGGSAVVCVGTPATLLPVVTGGSADTFAIDPTPPAGITLDAATGELTVAPVAPLPPTVFVITATNPAGSVADSVSITAEDPLCTLDYTDPVAIYTPGIAIVVNAPVTTCLTLADYAVDPPLPDGLALDPVTGEISGTPTTAVPAQDYSVIATSACGPVSATLQISVVDTGCSFAYENPTPVYPPGAAIAPNAPTGSCTGLAGFSVDPALPAGLLIDPDTGVISGTPVDIAPASDFTVVALSSTGPVSTVISIRVDNIFDLSAPDGVCLYDPVTGFGSTSQSIVVLEDPTNPGYPTTFHEFVLLVAHDDALLGATQVVPGADVAALGGGAGPDFFSPEIYDGFVTVGCVFSVFLMKSLEADVERELVVIDYATVAGALAGVGVGQTTEIAFPDEITTVPLFSNRLVITPAYQPLTVNHPGTMTLEPLP